MKKNILIIALITLLPTTQCFSIETKTVLSFGAGIILVGFSVCHGNKWHTIYTQQKRDAKTTSDTISTAAKRAIDNNRQDAKFFTISLGLAGLGLLAYSSYSYSHAMPSHTYWHNATSLFFPKQKTFLGFKVY
ncbi:MAG: hypothetical protein WC707_04105 [Candidatus Babeliaceae bacterium]|jgi:hypothetical protein